MKCKINWASLYTKDNEANDESIEVCPQCGSNMDLVELLQGPVYFMCPFTGDIIETTTRRPLVNNNPAPPVVVKPKFDNSTWRNKQAQRKAKENAAIDAYSAEYNKDERAAQEAYFKAFKQ